MRVEIPVEDIDYVRNRMGALLQVRVAVETPADDVAVVSLTNHPGWYLARWHGPSCTWKLVGNTSSRTVAQAQAGARLLKAFGSV